jgi:hypothetical protein
VHSPESTGESSADAAIDDDGPDKACKLTAKIDTAAITDVVRQSIKDLDAETERINASREAMSPPINRAAANLRLPKHQRR